MGNQMLVLFIGVPGTGKTTLAKRLRDYMISLDCENKTTIHEADHFFETPDGNYKFNPEDLPKAHNMCQELTDKDLEAGKNVIVCNTSLRAWERKPYIDMARKHKTGLYIVILDKVFGNVHGVPMDKVEAMKAKFEPVNSDEFKGINSVSFATYEELNRFLEGESY